ncbi:PREDICTED: UDP-glycosyltransferase 88F3-like [Nelumbo nucifera]|uniref:Glycosyltransferase n=2 Tax=Nelumbo nucifera TaxID=4432 RepID=A0A1U7Z2I0_NELNU|nr:PREDICTED: UDP-glycosyltransferase 88F3-like [Nelumbo nucifera]XP_010244852.1 PREDICTED: UDP-glycosyltransferase 88F3-like [Nelumbo nucifera]XP_010244853.1 PREDICTED: UDP-glycosyltransferase 88F3-like [Nelumbo nucifera]XP_010244854.1 PREDICTED: UDP-glycosyltransferase 88F3-like [Nelumbo nucifera]DAD39084.1 TPA_asm: hypothetical protein HUJ06_013407 [Nelumbo nucifera]
MKETIVLYPTPAMGHLVSIVELSKLILHHYPHQFSVTILLTTGLLDTPATTSYTNRISQTHPSIVFHRFPPLCNPPSLEPTPNYSLTAIAFEFIRLNNPNVLQALQTISETSIIRAFIIDFFCTSALHVASNLSIPTYYFFTSGAAALAAFLYFPTIHAQTTQSFKGLATTDLHFPGLPPIRASRLPEPVLDRADKAYLDFLYFTAHLPKAKGIIVNTFELLEPTAIKAVTSGLCVPDAPTPPVYYIGPLIADPDDRTGEGGHAGAHECLSWLDTQPSQSVVFLCFGSQGTFSVAQMKEIASGLEKSGQRFLWVVRSPPVEDHIKHFFEPENPDLDLLLPEGFLARIKGRGLVVKSWAPQVEVLNHDSVGGFVTHCGWNSVLEAVCAGVPMVAWPLYAEQHMNKAVLVEDLKLAMPIEQSEDGFVSSAEVETRLRALMASSEGKESRQRSREMKEKAWVAWSDGGSSLVAFSKLTEIWRQG